MSAPRWYERLSLEASPAMLQLPSLGGLALSLLAVPILPAAAITDPWEAWLGVALVLVAAAVAVFVDWTQVSTRAVIIVPLITLAGFAFFRVGTGGATSMFGALILLPILWIAGMEGRVHILIAGFGSCAAILLPYFLADVPWTDGQVARGFFVPLIYLVLAAVVNDLAHRARVQVAAAQALADERTERLAESERSAAALFESAARLRESEVFTRSIWNAVVYEAVIVTDLTGRVAAWNPGVERMTGISAADAEGIHVFDIIDREELRGRAGDLGVSGATFDEPAAFSQVIEAVRSHYGPLSEWTVVRGDRTTLPVEFSVVDRIGEDAARVGYIFVGIDQTQAKEVSRLKDEFVGMISHELRTPLSSILGYLELVRDDEEAPLTTEQQQYLGVAERNAHRLLALVGDLLFTAQVESGKFPLEITRVDLGGIVRASAESARPVADRAGVKLELIAPDTSVIVDGDPTRLGQACDNLLSNAIKFTRGSGGEVTLSLAMGDGEAVISIADTGMGIPRDELDKLFTRFFRASTATRQAVQGVGLGLSITKAIVTAHHGSISVDSVEGEGTTFSIRLPLAPELAGAE